MVEFKPYVILADLCEAILNNSALANESLAVTYTEAPPEEDDTESLWPPFWMTSGNDTNYTSLYNKTEIVIQLQTTTEYTVIPVLAMFGIVFNCIMSVLLKSDHYISKRTYGIFQFLFVIEIFYLISVIVFVSFRNAPKEWDVDVMGYITLCVGYFQFLVHWTFYFAQKDALMSLKGLWRPEKKPKCKNHTLDILFLIGVAFLLHIPYIPFVRIQLYFIHSVFNPCTVPLEDIWDMRATRTRDWYYMMYFFVFYFAIVYCIPFFLVGSIDKDIVDLLWLLKDKSDLHIKVIHAAHTVKAVGILSNIYLVCLSNKAVVIGFRIVHFFVMVFRGIHIFFYFLNFIGNMMLVLRPTFNLVVFLFYTKKVYATFKLKQGLARLKSKHHKHEATDV